jgi:hypothetical protein
MTFFEKLQLLQRVNKLIARKGTGTPQSLANRLEVPERTLYCLLTEMKNFGFPIQYCKERQSYYYTKTIRFGFDLHVLDKEEANNVEGGTFFDFFSKKYFHCHFFAVRRRTFASS